MGVHDLSDTPIQASNNQGSGADAHGYRTRSTGKAPDTGTVLRRRHTGICTRI